MQYTTHKTDRCRQYAFTSSCSSPPLLILRLVIALPIDKLHQDYFLSPSGWYSGLFYERVYSPKAADNKSRRDRYIQREKNNPYQQYCNTCIVCCQSVEILDTNRIITIVRTTVRCHKNRWIYLTSTYYWWLLRPTITVRRNEKTLFAQY